MKKLTHRTQNQIFDEMYRELRAYNPDIPESEERMDPILRILMQVYAHQLEQVDRRLDKTWEISSAELIRSVCPERGRWPVPAFTVMRVKPIDPTVEVDTNTRFFYKEKREGGKTFFFSPERDSKIIAAHTRKIYLRNEKKIYDISPIEEGGYGAGQTNIPVSSSSKWEIYFAVQYDGPPSGLKNAVIFASGSKEALAQLRWSNWSPGRADGSFDMTSGFCPGMVCSIEDVLSNTKEITNWGGLRNGKNLFTTIENNFVILQPSFCDNWTEGPIAKEIAQLRNDNMLAALPAEEHYYWIKIDLPVKGSRAAFQAPLNFYFDCFIVTNKNELTLFKHTGGNKLVEIEIPEDINTILEVVSVVDSEGNDYRDVHNLQSIKDQRVYILEERGKKLVLWFDFSNRLEIIPDSITVTYAVTAGTDANGIDKGKIANLYENHPGLKSCENITPVTGAIPARTEKQILTEVSSRLRQRDRAITFEDISSWAMVFDPRIKNVICQNGIERINKGGVRRCVILTLSLNFEEFYSNDEVSLLKTRLIHFLKARSQVNSQYQVEAVSV